MQPNASSAPSVPLPRPRRKKAWRVVTAVLLVLVLLLVTATGAGYWIVHKSAPVVKGNLALPGLTDQVSVWRDDNGVPHIEAKSEHDLYMAQGFVTAQDRMFQMDLSRRQASGELSEVVGAAALDRDKFFRTFGLRRAAEASLASYSPDAKQVLDWYADGVNAYMKQAKDTGSLPPEFRILGYQPKDWTAVDSLAIGKYMAYDLGGHWEAQVFRYWLAQNVTPEKALDLFPDYPANGPTIIQALKETPLDVQNRFTAAVIPNEFNGSNNWVVSGSKTESGKPLLANDPHLSLATPSIWYQTELKAGDLDVSGVIFAGIPGIILGHNQHVAWGVTNVGPDVQDLYIEKRNPANKYQFEYMGKWEDAKVIKEEIKVKDSSPVPCEVVVTRHGPVISEFAHDGKPDTALAMRWTALEPSAELEAIQRFAKAKNWDEFKTALTYFHTPAQNFVFAADDGTIAYRANGLIPIRKKGDSSVPVPGWTDEYEWQGYIPWDDLPTTVNPSEGFIATANNKVVSDSYAYHITNIWAQPYRSERIRQVLESKPKLTADDMKALQHDQTNLEAEEFASTLLASLKQAGGDSLRQTDKDAIALLEKWDHVDRANEGAPLVWNLWIGKIADVLFKPEINDDMYKLFEGRSEAVDDLIRRAAKGSPGPWITEKGGLGEVALNAFKQTVDQITTLQGSSASKWNWGDYHAVTFSHPLSAVKPLDLLFNPSANPMGGSKVTVEAAGWDAVTGEVNHGGAWRTVVDFTDLSKTYNVVGPGQSGHLLSPWYDDQAKDWATDKYHVTSSDPSVYQKAGNHLVLSPK